MTESEPIDPNEPNAPSEPHDLRSQPSSSPHRNRPARSKPDRKSPPQPQPQVGEIEVEFGVPLAGTILPPEQWARTALKKLPEQGTIDFNSLFGREAPRVLDIGCGNGRFTLSSAVRRPHLDHIGIDPLPLVIRYATRRANQRGLHHVRFAACDGMRFLSDYCGAGSLAEVHIYHPQPYQAREEHHKRLFTPEFFLQLHRVLEPGGKLFFQTDNPAYWSYIAETLSQVMIWHEQNAPWPEDPQGRTRREIIALNKGLPIFRGWATRRDDLDAEALERICDALPQPTFSATPKRNPNAWRRKPRGRRNR